MIRKQTVAAARKLKRSATLPNQHASKGRLGKHGAHGLDATDFSQWRPGEDAGAVLSRVTLMPSMQAAATILKFLPEITSTQDPGQAVLDIYKLMKELGRQAEVVSGGDFQQVEAMLVAQAHALNTMFGALSCRAMATDYLPNQEMYLRLALKAQSQSRATLQTLSEVKYPPTFIRQQNVGAVQQINNGEHPDTIPGSRAREISEKSSNKLLESSDGKRVDGTTTGPAINADPQLETVDKINRASKPRR